MNLHFATKLFTAVSNFLGHCIWVPVPYKQTKNKINATNDITAGSCYREVHWNSKVSTNGQNPTLSHLSARSQLRNRQWPSSSPCVAGHRQVHQEKQLHFSKEPAQGCWKLKNNLSDTLGLFTPWIFTLRLKLFTAVSTFLGHCIWVPAPYKQTKNQINATNDITAGSCYREVHWNSKVSTNGQNPTLSHFSARSQLRNRQWPSSSAYVAGHRQVHQEKQLHFSKEPARAAESSKITYLTVWAF